MFQHGPSCLEGPISRQSSRWRHKAARQPSAEDRPIRWELVERVRQEIVAGTYDTPEKMEIALDRLLDRLDRE